VTVLTSGTAGHFGKGQTGSSESPGGGGSDVSSEEETGLVLSKFTPLLLGKVVSAVFHLLCDEVIDFLFSCVDESG